MPNQMTNDQLQEWYQRFARELREKVNIDVTQKADLGRVKNYAIKRWTPDDHGELVLEEPSFAFMPHNGTKPVNPAPTNVPFETYSQWLMDNLPEKVGIDQIRTLYEMSRAGTLMVSPPGENSVKMRQVYTDENGRISTSMDNGWYSVKLGQPVPDEKKLPELPAFVEAPNPAKYGQPPEPPAPDEPENMNPGFFSWLGYKLGFNTDYAKLVAYKEYCTEYPQLLKRTHHETDAHFDSRVEKWAARRNAVAEELALDPSLIATRSQIESIANNEDKGLGALMSWQRQLLTR